MATTTWAVVKSVTAPNFENTGGYKLELLQTPPPRFDRHWREATTPQGVIYYWKWIDENAKGKGHLSQWERPLSWRRRPNIPRTVNADLKNIIVKLADDQIVKAYVYLIPDQGLRMRLTRIDHDEKLEDEKKRVLQELRDDPDSFDLDSFDYGDESATEFKNYLRDDKNMDCLVAMRMCVDGREVEYNESTNLDGREEENYYRLSSICHARDLPDQLRSENEDQRRFDGTLCAYVTYAFSYGNTKLTAEEKKANTEQENKPTLADPVCEATKQMHWIEHNKSPNLSGSLCAFANESSFGFCKVFWRANPNLLCSDLLAEGCPRDLLIESEIFPPPPPQDDTVHNLISDSEEEDEDEEEDDEDEDEDEDDGSSGSSSSSSSSNSSSSGSSSSSSSSSAGIVIIAVFIVKTNTIPRRKITVPRRFINAQWTSRIFWQV